LRSSGQLRHQEQKEASVDDELEKILRAK
jgi:hypothetical protein